MRPWTPQPLADRFRRHRIWADTERGEGAHGSLGFAGLCLIAVGCTVGAAMLGMDGPDEGQGTAR